MNEELENKITQLRKGILELAVMGLLYEEAHYGYSLVTTRSDTPGSRRRRHRLHGAEHLF
jgi:DNA-binding PadR family transcriptional regulator